MKERVRRDNKLSCYIGHQIQESIVVSIHVNAAGKGSRFKNTYAAAVLTENGFMDSEVSLSFLGSDDGKKAIVALYGDGIIDFFEHLVV